MVADPKWPQKWCKVVCADPVFGWNDGDGTKCHRSSRWDRSISPVRVGGPKVHGTSDTGIDPDVVQLLVPAGLYFGHLSGGGERRRVVTTRAVQCQSGEAKRHNLRESDVKKQKVFGRIVLVNGKRV